MPGRLLTSESVTESHPDKIADQTSDTILDALLRLASTAPPAAYRCPSVRSRGRSSRPTVSRTAQPRYARTERFPTCDPPARPSSPSSTWEVRPVRLDTVVFSSQHAGDNDLEGLLAPDIREHLVERLLAQLADDGITLETDDHRLLVNPTGRFESGGPMGAASLTDRKNIIDTYGGTARHGDDAFSGKDPSKVDRSAAYAMREVA